MPQPAETPWVDIDSPSKNSSSVKWYGGCQVLEVTIISPPFWKELLLVVENARVKYTAPYKTFFFPFRFVLFFVPIFTDYIFHPGFPSYCNFPVSLHNINVILFNMMLNLLYHDFVNVDDTNKMIYFLRVLKIISFQRGNCYKKVKKKNAIEYCRIGISEAGFGDLVAFQ